MFGRIVQVIKAFVFVISYACCSKVAVESPPGRGSILQPFPRKSHHFKQDYKLPQAIMVLQCLHVLGPRYQETISTNTLEFFSGCLISFIKMAGVPQLLQQVSCHAWNGDKSLIAVSPNNDEIHIYATNNNINDCSKWTVKYVLQEVCRLASLGYCLLSTYFSKLFAISTLIMYLAWTGHPSPTCLSAAVMIETRTCGSTMIIRKTRGSPLLSFFV